MAYREEAPVGRKKCAHGLMYDPGAVEGCVLCRRDPGELDHPAPLLAPEATPRVPPATPPLDTSRPSRGVGPLVAVLLLVITISGSWGYVLTQWNAPRPGCTSGVDCGVAPTSPSPSCKGPRGAPPSCLDACFGGCPAGSECVSVTLVDGLTMRRAGQCLPTSGRGRR